MSSPDTLKPDTMTSKYDQRQEAERDRKEAIGKYVKELLCNNSRQDEAIRSELDKVVVHTQNLIGSRKNNRVALQAALREASREFITADKERRAFNRNIMQQLEKADERSKERFRRTRNILTDFWSKTGRYSAIDAGTTTEAIAVELAKPPHSNQINLRVLTNAPPIEDRLKINGCPIEVVGLGGQLRKETMARYGHLADACLAAWSHLRIDVTIVGTTGFDLDAADNPRGFACDSDEESRIKSKFLELARLRCVVFDSTKCENSASSSFVFANVSASQVDIVITDEDIDKKENANGERFVNWFLAQGILVLRAPLLNRNR